MALTFQQLRQLKQHGLPLSTILVFTYLAENGPQPVGVIADACGVSIRSVERALAAVRRLGLFPTKQSHDHVHGDHGLEGTAPALAGVEATQPDADDVSDDPVRAKLLEYEVLPWCVDILLAKVERAILVRQLEYHAFRLASGFKFRGHPARYLFRACLNDYVLPEGFHATAHKAREGVLSEPQVPTFHPAAERPVDGPLDAPAKVETVRKMLTSPIPASRRLGLKLAAEWGIDLAELSQEVG